MNNLHDEWHMPGRFCYFLSLRILTFYQYSNILGRGQGFV